MNCYPFCSGWIRAWGAYSFKPSAGIAGKCTQNRLQISLIYVSAPNSPLLLHTKCTFQRRTQRPPRVEQECWIGSRNILYQESLKVKLANDAYSTARKNNVSWNPLNQILIIMQVWNSQCIHTAVLPLFICSDYLSALEVPGIRSLYLL